MDATDFLKTGEGKSKFQIRYLILILVWAMLAIPLHGIEKSEKCPELSDDYAHRYAELIQQGLYEEMTTLLATWEHECGLTEPVFRAKALQLIQSRTFPGILNEENILEQAIAFEIREKLVSEGNYVKIREYYELYPEFFGYVSPGHPFDIQTRQWARRLKSEVASGSFSYIFLQLYEGQTEEFFATLRDGFFQDTRLAAQYKNKLETIIKLPELNLGVNAGLWVPSGNLDVLGLHPSIGIVLGAKTKNTYFDAVFEFRFGKAAEDVMITVRDTLVATRNYQGGYAGIEVSQILIRTNNSSWELFAGGGYDIIDIVEDAIDPERQSFGSPAIHLGVGYKFYFKNRTWLSVKPGVYILNHKHATGSSLDGNAISFRLTYGFSENARKSENLKRLGIYQWW
jgi:hypothetical protein